MPQAPKKACSFLGCPHLTNERYCPKHKRKTRREYDTLRRPKRHKVYKTARWKRLRVRVLSRQPICNAKGCNKPAVEVDHIIPIEKEPKLIWKLRNLQGLCKSCHSRKTAHETFHT